MVSSLSLVKEINVIHALRTCPVAVANAEDDLLLKN